MAGALGAARVSTRPARLAKVSLGLSDRGPRLGLGPVCHVIRPS